MSLPLCWGKDSNSWLNCKLELAKCVIFLLDWEEKAILSLDLVENERKSVVSTGGSAVLRGKSVEHLKKNGFCVYIKLELCEIERRINNRSTRGIAAEKNEEKIGSVTEVLIEGYSKRSKEDMYGRTSQYKTVVFPREGRKIGELVMVKIEEASAATLKGKLV